MRHRKLIRTLLWWPLAPLRRRRMADPGGSTLRCLYDGYAGARPAHPDPIYGPALAAAEVMRGRQR